MECSSLAATANSIFTLAALRRGHGGANGNNKGTVWTDEDEVEILKTLKPVKNGKLIEVTFDSNVSSSTPFKFKPITTNVKVVAGETALAFFSCKNLSDKPVTGVATYNVYPPKAGLYFNKVQCFCFEEQRLGGREEIDMPVFFYIDPEIVDDPAMQNVQNITLSYTFFKTGQEDDEEEEGETVQLQKQ